MESSQPTTDLEWHKQYHKKVGIFPDRLAVAKDETTEELTRTKREPFEVELFAKIIFCALL